MSITLLRTIDKRRARRRGTGNRVITVNGHDKLKFPKVPRAPAVFSQNVLFYRVAPIKWNAVVRQQIPTARRCEYRSGMSMEHVIPRKAAIIRNQARFINPKRRREILENKLYGIGTILKRRQRECNRDSVFFSHIPVTSVILADEKLAGCRKPNLSKP